MQDRNISNLEIGIRSVEVIGKNILKIEAKNATRSENDICQTHLNNSECKMILSEYQNDDHWFDTQSQILLVLFYCIVMVFGVLSNSMICYIVIKFKALRSPRNILILNLSICDISMCIFCMPFSLIRLTLKNWHLGNVLCKMTPSFQTIDVFVSTFTIVAIATDRYCAIVKVSRDYTHRYFVYYVIALIWVMSFLLCIPMILFHEVHAVSPSILDMTLYNICMEVWPSETWKKVYTTVVMVLQYMAPLAVITSLHARICSFLRMRINGNPKTETEMDRVLREIRRQRKNLLLLTAIAMSFALAWLPLTVLNTLADYNYQLFMDKHFNYVYAYCLLLAMSSASINPIMYGWFNTNFREAFIDVMCCRKKNMHDSLEMASIKYFSKESVPLFAFLNRVFFTYPLLSNMNLQCTKC
ncbi:hypothetical protein CHS0354_036401 [Potamilus streckersoni]|uniref:G-protein coupled receptors family 1 profile domain-containing protein n=1 Tax=Potamilus streckersoni TaxID=2493646 RepID=A0AAE0SX28_9BIVA|nr:hypothetical protein CHS0354_036401 [Potamilus streckersoni]